MIHASGGRCLSWPFLTAQKGRNETVTTPTTSDFFTLNGKTLTFGKQADRYRKNIAAVKLLRHLQEEGLTGSALTEEQRFELAHYSAFGESALLNRAFSGEKKSALVNMTSEREQAAIRRTSLTAFYTPQDILDVFWSAVTPSIQTVIERGETLSMLDPSFGATGMFVATMPVELRQQSRIVAVELDQLSSQIAALLHPDVMLHGSQGFEAADLSEDTFDLVMSNVPFGSKVMFDPEMVDFAKTTIHDYFLARSLKLVRRGGIVAIITSYGTMDKRDSRFRRWVAERAQLLRAVRLPQGAFSANSGTECGADLLIFRRREVDGYDQEPLWVGTEEMMVPVVESTQQHFTFGSRESEADTEATETGLRFNKYFIYKPNRVVGTVTMARNSGSLWRSIVPPTDATVAECLALNLSLPDDMISPRIEAEISNVPAKVSYIRSSTNPRVRAMLAVYDASKATLRLDVQGLPAEAEREAMNAAYAALLSDYGPIHSRSNMQALRGEPELLFLKALESDVQTISGVTTAAKAALFSRPTVRPTAQVVPGEMQPDEALVCCLDSVGKVDIAHIAALCGQQPAEVIAALNGRIFCDPVTGVWITADEYLSGDVRQKLGIARQAAERDPQFEGYIQALEAVQPIPLTAGQIKAKFGASWLPKTVVRDFINYLIPGFSHAYGGEVYYVPPAAQWVVSSTSKITGHMVTSKWGTLDVHALEIIEYTLNQRSPSVFRWEGDGENRKQVLDKQGTAQAREKCQLVKEAWYKWVWADVARTDELVTLYNNQFNSWRRRDFDGSHLRLSGLNTAVLRTGDLDAHQKDAVWMGLQSPSMLVHLPVGGGKTFVGLTLAREYRRLGLAKKPMIVAPNHLVEQWASEANRLYPDMRVLAMSSEDFAKAKRGTFLSRIATEEWDAIIIAETSFQFIEIGTAANEFIEERIFKLRQHFDALHEQFSEERNRLTKRQKRTLKDIERKIERLEVKLQSSEYSVRHDDARIITWAETGIDAVIVDECHNHKNLQVITAMGNIPGIPTGDSQRSFDMRLKTWDLRRRGCRVVFMTATPIMNTLGEVYVFQTYLQDDVLKEHGIAEFDSWASVFAETEMLFEMAPDGSGFRMNTRLCRFVNAPELFSFWYRFTFSRSKKQLSLPAPKFVTGKPIPVAVPASQALKRYSQECANRADAIRSGSVEPWQDNMLKVVSDGRKAALDPRMVGLPKPQVGKIEVMCDYLATLYHQYSDVKATQLVYCELGTPRHRTATTVE